MNRLILAALCMAMAMPAVSLAQGSGSSPRPAMPTRMGDYPGSSAPYVVTRLFEGKIAEIKADQHVVVVEDKKGKRLEVKIVDQTKLKADKKTEFGSKKNLLLSDFEVGQPVRVTYLASNNMATELRLRHVKR